MLTHIQRDMMQNRICLQDQQTEDLFTVGRDTVQMMLTRPADQTQYIAGYHAEQIVLTRPAEHTPCAAGHDAL